MKSIDPKLVRMGRRLFESCVTIVDIQNENQAHPTIQAKCDLFIGPMQFSNENSCSLTTSLWCVLTLRRVFTVCRLDFIWFGYSLSMNCIHYTPRSSCTGNRHTQTRIRTHLRLLTMFVLGHVDSWMKLSRKENTQCVERQQQKQRNETQRRIRRCLNVSRFIQSRVHFSLDVRRLWTLCYCVMVWWIHCVWRLMRTLEMYLLFNSLKSWENLLVTYRLLFPFKDEKILGIPHLRLETMKCEIENPIGKLARKWGFCSLKSALSSP